ncbi:restriction endonuclease subunit S [Vibrio cyclitrophicus 1F111]|uniref:restriction endonuclease subunit S n=1 Tax=Vibrio cyclitrophicus TaxID=47951 RepID=UPI0002DEB559|nr:restriction endonuclease subunit S [Vibrio cyclitrophicus]OEF74399.1 restriction endonuclease subunit S [Vibrio cyclitrophicus 1F111]
MTGRYKAYPEYKDSGVKFVRNIPAHWSVSKVCYISTFGRGLSITKANLEDKGIPCVSYGEVHSKYGFEVDPKKHLLKCVNPTYLDTSPFALLSKGDFVFADTSEDIEGSGNFTQLISDETLFAGYHTVVVRPDTSNYYRFIAYLFDSREFRTQIRDAVKGVKVFSVTQAILKNANVWLPEFEEQHKIANFLDHETAKIDTLITKQEKLIELLKEKRQAVISHAVTKGLNPDAQMKDSGVEWLGEVPEHWEMKKLKYIGEAKNGLTYSPDNVVSENEGVLVLRSSNIQNASLSFNDNVYVNIDIPEKIKTKKDDLLICSRNGSRKLIGKNALITEGAAGMAFGAFMVIYRSPINPYLFWIFNSPLFEYQSGSFLTSTINQLTIGNLDSMEVPLPPSNEQEMIKKYLVNKNQYFDALTAKSKLKVKLLVERKTALISAAVTGKIDVRDWEGEA